MGTNYYLHRKTEFNPLHRIPASLGCGDDHEHEPIELVNGWVWHNKYYATLEALNAEFYQDIHIGKSSCGWRFLLCKYPAENPRFKDAEECFREIYLDKPIETIYDWTELFHAPGNKIFDEYGEEVSAQDMILTIVARKPQPDLIDGWQKLNVGTEFESREEYRAINGLLVHDNSNYCSSIWIDPKREQYMTIMPDDYTYDMVLSGNDVESGEIFC